MRIIAWLMAGAVLLSATPLAAQSTRSRVEDLELRVAQLEQILQSQTLIEMSQRLEAQAAELRELRGALESAQNENQQLRKQLADVAADFDRRLVELERRPVTPIAQPIEAGAGASVSSEAVNSSAPNSSAPNPSAEALYSSAFDALKAARYPEAIDGMKAFLVAHPQHPLADNAQYWLGQTYYLSRDYQRAVEAFSAVGSRSPDRSKAPDALLKKGLSEIELKRVDDARRSFGELLQRYPESDAARVATDALQKLR
ncbi:MAG: tol-pal system protein YbgF [Steroidobacteraceae bacterium]